MEREHYNNTRIQQVTVQLTDMTSSPTITVAIVPTAVNSTMNFQQLKHVRWLYENLLPSCLMDTMMVLGGEL